MVQLTCPAVEEAEAINVGTSDVVQERVNNGNNDGSCQFKQGNVLCK